MMMMKMMMGVDDNDDVDDDTLPMCLALADKGSADYSVARAQGIEEATVHFLRCADKPMLISVKTIARTLLCVALTCKISSRRFFYRYEL